ncbi:hypothetical protein KNN17_03635 [Arthrobacter bambusae]|uniref:hypothetical protein n=1 Tax=Arthrobacter bambusae TaxID=1338426 RepID=UPI001F5134D9|nr:hypothetical protein [Arthrobacter bambusae]MCI0140664.1 hypothetical protein [Arthrobacter bambusae]
MNLLSAVSSIDVVIQAEAVEWWQVVAALTPLAALLLPVFVVLRLCKSTTAPAAESERHAEWWSRAEWAMDMALDHNPERQKVGLAVLNQLSSDRLVGKEDAHIVAEARALLNKP